MKLAFRVVDLASIRLDGGTQVRDGLDEDWVRELVALYEEDHEIDPILVVLDPGGSHWLADGFHRLEAQRRLDRHNVKAVVRDGPAATLDMAKMLASAANKNGRPLSDGEKSKAVRLAGSTPEGAKMTVRDLARHCGVSKSHVDRILNEGKIRSHSPCPGGDTSSGGGIRSEASSRGAQRRHQEKWTQIDAKLKADPGRPDIDIARELDVTDFMVRGRRSALGLPKSDSSRWQRHPSKDKAEEILKVHPEWSNDKIAKEAHASAETVSRLRAKHGIAPRRKGPAPKSKPPSAPTRKGGDPREGPVEVLQAHPLPPAAAPSYASSAERDTAKVILDSLRVARGSFKDPSWALLLNQIDEITHVRSPEA